MHAHGCRSNSHTEAFTSLASLGKYRVLAFRTRKDHVARQHCGLEHRSIVNFGSAESRQHIVLELRNFTFFRSGARELLDPMPHRAGSRDLEGGPL